MKLLVTGCAGFVGYHLTRLLLDNGEQVVGVDNLNDYYDVSLKRARLDRLMDRAGFSFYRLDIANREAMAGLFASERPERVVNLAAQAGVRYSLKNPHAYVNSNLVGFVNILEGCRTVGVEHLVYASSSSVYGANPQMPYAVGSDVDHPVSLYAATKRSNELMAYSYSHLFGLPCTGLRFFTVYGPWGRPDMAIFLFTRAILEGKPIDVYNDGQMKRDFTFVDDIVEGVSRVLRRVPEPQDGVRSRIYNIGNNRPVELLHLIETLETCLGRTAIKRFLPLQPGDMPATWADIDDLIRDVGFRPETPIEEGIRRFTDWYREYYASS